MSGWTAARGSDLGYYAEKLSGERLRQCYKSAPPRVQQYLDAEISHVLSRIQPGDSVLELGCGYGRVTMRLAQVAGRVVGIDTARESIQLARQLAGPESNCEFLEMDAVAMDFEDDRFDAVVCVQNGVCAFGVDQARLLTESIRVVRPGGLVILSSYADAFWPTRLSWFELQSRQGLVGELDLEACRDGVIVCRDGFRAGTMDRQAFEQVCGLVGVEPRIEVVDASSIFCEITKDAQSLASLVAGTVRRVVRTAATVTRYREPLVGFVAADDPRFARLAEFAGGSHRHPKDLLPGAKSVVSFFVPFSREVVEANAPGHAKVAREWALAYTETNALIERVRAALASALEACGVRSESEPATGRFNRTDLTSEWSHKSVGLMAGLGSFGVHRMLITDRGCAGRLGSVVLDEEIPAKAGPEVERCLHLASGGCLACVRRCPVGALDADGGLDRQRCWDKCRSAAVDLGEPGGPQVCGKCAVGPCALGAPGASKAS